MTHGEDLTREEAKRLMLQRLVAAPDAWRGRASAAGGFLGAAAAVSFWGLTNSTEKFPYDARVAASVASVCYVVAVAAFLAASVWHSPKAKSEKTQDFFESTREYVQSEAAPIKRLVRLGGVMAVLAIAATTACSLTLLEPSGGRPALVVVQDPAQMRAISTLCPGIENPFSATVIESDSVQIVLDVSEVSCRENRSVVTVARDYVVVSEWDSP